MCSLFVRTISAAVSFFCCTATKPVDKFLSSPVFGKHGVDNCVFSVLDAARLHQEKLATIVKDSVHCEVESFFESARDEQYIEQEISKKVSSFITKVAEQAVKWKKIGEDHDHLLLKRRSRVSELREIISSLCKIESELAQLSKKVRHVC